ncbi:hypothetical protein DAPPUDRAFT_269172, partial [Daphnia pulex]
MDTSANMATAQLPVITEELASVAEQEQSTVVDPKTMDKSQLVRQRGTIKSRHTRLLTTLHSGMTFNIEGQFKDEARKLRTTLVQEYENVELCHNLVLAACATQEEFNKEFCWFETFPEAHRKMLADISAYLGEGLATSLKPADKIQEKARKVAETELRLKQAQEEARLREIEEEKIRRLEEDKRKEELKVEAERTQRQLRNELEGHHLESQILIQQLEVEREGARPVTPIEAQENFSSKSTSVATPVFSVQQLPESSVPAKGALAKIKAPPGDGSSASLAAPLASSEKKKTSWPQPSTPEIITVPPSPTAPAQAPPRCEASDQNQFLRPPFSGSNENWERTLEQDDGRYAETLGNKAVSQSVSATFLNPLAGAFEPRAGFFSLPGSSMSVVQPRSFGDCPPGGGFAPTQTSSTSAGPPTTCVAAVSFPASQPSRSTALPPSSYFYSLNLPLSRDSSRFSAAPITTYTTPFGRTTMAQSGNPLITRQPSHLDLLVPPTSLVARHEPTEPPTSVAGGFSEGLREEVSSPDGWIYDIERHRRTAMPGFRSLSRLPKIELPKFAGDPLKWPMFIQTFGAQVDRCCCDDSERQAFLRNCLSTDIQMQLGECLLHPGLYQRCLQELHRKFGNPRVIATACSRALLELSSFNDGNFKALQKFSAALRSCVATLRFGGY